MKDIYRLQGIRGYFLGLIPYTLAYFNSNLNLNIEPKASSVKILENSLLVTSLLLYNPLNILTVRMQCIEFKERKLR